MEIDFDRSDGCIVMEKVNKQFGSRHILKNVSLCIAYGSIYGLLGPSGCGKTTTVKIMAGILEATTGSTVVLGGSMPSLDLMGQIGYMAQSDALYPSLTAKENLEFFGSLYGMNAEQLSRRIPQVMDLVDLSSRLDEVVSAYSGGMKRRLSLAAAILHNPKLLILDEPTVGIDPVLRKNIWDELRHMTKQGVTILVTTHVMDEAEKCTRLSMMREGTLLASGTPGEITAGAKASTLEEAFLIYSGCAGGDDHDA